MDILVSRTLYMSCQAGPGIEPGPSALKASALPIELTWQTCVLICYYVYHYEHFMCCIVCVCITYYCIYGMFPLMLNTNFNNVTV